MLIKGLYLCRLEGLVRMMVEQTNSNPQQITTNTQIAHKLDRSQTDHTNWIGHRQITQIAHKLDRSQTDHTNCTPIVQVTDKSHKLITNWSMIT